jgi:hypothetical protein
MILKVYRTRLIRRLIRTKVFTLGRVKVKPFALSASVIIATIKPDKETMFIFDTFRELDHIV